MLQIYFHVEPYSILDYKNSNFYFSLVYPLKLRSVIKEKTRANFPPKPLLIITLYYYF